MEIRANPGPILEKHLGTLQKGLFPGARLAVVRRVKARSEPTSLLKLAACRVHQSRGQKLGEFPRVAEPLQVEQGLFQLLDVRPGVDAASEQAEFLQHFVARHRVLVAALGVKNSFTKAPAVLQSDFEDDSVAPFVALALQLGVLDDFDFSRRSQSLRCE
jgi:hypothetical protein